MLRRRPDPEPALPMRTVLARIVAKPLECVVGDHFAPGTAVALLILGGFVGLVVTIAITLSVANAVLVVVAATVMRLYCGRASRRTARP